MRSIKQSRRPVAYGSGLVALDVVLDQENGIETRFAGGTCGNVLAILAFLGWRSVPVARLADDFAGSLIREDLERWGLDLEYLGLQPQTATPVIIQKIYRDKMGLPRHRFLWTCPDCGAYLPQFRPVPVKQLEIVKSVDAQVFFFDRVSPGNIEMARRFADKGAVVVFEPSASSDPRLFREAVRICHILKYASQRVRPFTEHLGASKAWLEIETLGDEGLRYRTAPPMPGDGSWKYAPAFEVKNVKDTAGCGDWCTAGLLAGIARNGQKSMAETSLDFLESILQYAQALSAWNCTFPAARGGMYLASRSSMTTAIDEIISGASRLRRLRRKKHKNLSAVFCPHCAESNQNQQTAHWKQPA